MLTINKLLSEDLLKEAEREIGRYEWEGTFADYLGIVSDDASVSRLSHKLIYDSIVSGTRFSSLDGSGWPTRVSASSNEAKDLSA